MQNNVKLDEDLNPVYINELPATLLDKPNRESVPNFFTKFKDQAKEINSSLGTLDAILLVHSLSSITETPSLSHIRDHGVTIFNSNLVPLFLKCQNILIDRARKPITMVSDKFYVSTAAPQQFNFAVTNLLEQGYDMKRHCPNLTSSFIKEDDLLRIGLYSKYIKNSVYGINNVSGTKISVNLGHMVNSAVDATELMTGGIIPSPLSMNEILTSVLKKPTSSGQPFKVKKNTINVVDFVSQLEEFIDDSKFKVSTLVSLGTNLNHRFQVGWDPGEMKSSVKSRLIFVCSLYTISLGALFFAPINILFEESSLKYNYASNYMSPEQLSSTVSAKRFRASPEYGLWKGQSLSDGRLSKGNKNKLINVDFKKLDTSIQPYFKILFFLCFYPLCSEQAWLFGSFQNYTLVYWSFAVCSTYQYFYYKGNIPNVSSGSTISGEYITSLFNTWVHLAVLFYYKRTVNPALTIGNNGDIVVQGDDGLYTSMVNLGIFSNMCDKLGLTVDPKSKHYHFLSNKLYFLGRYFDKFSRQYQNKHWFYSHCVYPGYTPEIGKQALFTMRNYSLITSTYSRKFAIKLFSKIDKQIAVDYQNYLISKDELVLVKDRLTGVRPERFGEILNHYTKKFSPFFENENPT
jgi:hypothetical protein